MKVTIEQGTGCVVDGSVRFLIPDDYPQNISSPQIRLGNNVQIRSGCVLYAPLEIGDDATLDHYVILRQGCVVGSNTRLMNFADIGCNVVIGSESRIRAVIGNNSRIGDRCSVFGDLVHEYRNPVGGVMEPAPILEDDVVVGWRAIIIGGVFLPKNCKIQAGQIISRASRLGHSHQRTRPSI